MNTFESFLPTDYTPPASGGHYYKLQDGINKFRILSSPIVGWLAWDRNGDKATPVRTEYTQEGYNKAVNIARQNIDKKDQSVKHFWAMVVWDYSSDEVKIFELTQKGIQESLRNLSQNPDWGNPVKAYDITITKSGSGIETKYNFSPIPPKPLDPEIEAKLEEKPINLRALYYNADPFDPNWDEQEAQADETF